MAEKQALRRRRYLEAVGTAAVVGTAGCADVLTDDGETEGPDEETEDPDEESEDSEDDQEFDGAITVGHIAPLATPVGVGSDRAARLAAAQINDSGGIGGERLEVITKDTLSQAAEAEFVTEELVVEEDAEVIVGGFLAEASRAVTDLTSEFDVPFVNTGATGSLISKNFLGGDYETYNHYFRVGPLNASLQAAALRDYCVSLSDRHGWNSLTMYRDRAVWTEPFGSQLPALLREAGLTIEDHEALTIRNPDLSGPISTTTESDADYMFRLFAHIGGSPEKLYTEWNETLPFGIEGIHVPGRYPEYDIATEGLNLFETTGQYGGGGVAPITDKTTSFVETYTEEYAGDTFEAGTPDGAPMQMGFGTYDALQMVANVLEDTGTRPSEDLDGFVDAMLGREHTGVSGEISFYGPDSEYPHDVQPVRAADGTITNFPVTQFQPYSGGNAATVEYDTVDRYGQVECVFPDRHRTAEHLQPSWI